MWGGSVFLGRQPRPRPKGMGPQRPQKILGPTCLHCMKNSNQFLHDDQARPEESFYTIDNEC